MGIIPFHHPLGRDFHGFSLKKVGASRMGIPWHILGSPCTGETVAVWRLGFVTGRRNKHRWQNGGRFGPCLPTFKMTWDKTLPKTNMEPQNGDLEDEFLFQRDDFRAPC